MYYRQHTSNSIGAQKASFINHLKVIKNYNIAEFYHYIQQASDFYQYIKNTAKVSDKRTIQRFLNLPEQNRLQRRITIIKNKLFYKEIGKDIAVFLKI